MLLSVPSVAVCMRGRMGQHSGLYRYSKIDIILDKGFYRVLKGLDTLVKRK